MCRKVIRIPSFVSKMLFINPWREVLFWIEQGTAYGSQGDGVGGGGCGDFGFGAADVGARLA